jgi:tripartite-type tricarboxylate transporter receptor subunit TctC
MEALNAFPQQILLAPVTTMTAHVSRRGISVCFAALVFALTHCVCAQDYPVRAIRLVVNFPAGGPVDTFARSLSAQLTAQLGWSFVIDNRGGANGIIGADIVAKATPDGYTMLFSPSAIALNQVFNSKVPYDLLKDLIPVSNVAWGDGYLIIVHPSVPARSMKEFLALARKKDSRLTYGTAGAGSPMQLVGELFNLRAGTHLLNVPYKGIAPAITGLLGGEVDLMFIAPTAVVSHIKSGRLRALAYSRTTRWPGMPEIPTVIESGVPDFEMRAGWHGWFAPARTPERIVNRLAAEIGKAIQSPKLRESFIAGGYEPIGSSPAEFYKLIDSELKRIADIARAAKIKVE